MKILKISTGFVFLMVMSPMWECAFADITSRMAECAGIKSNDERLKCFDNLAGQQAPLKATTQQTPLKINETRIAPAENTSKVQASLEVPKPSVMSKLWELDPSSRKSSPLIRVHRPNYMLPVTYNFSLNKDSILDVDPIAKAQNTEAKFQISFKVKLWEDVMDKDMDLWFGYTQLAFWQLYNAVFSSPFRETDYEPELLLNFRTDYNILGLKGRMINLGLNHQSNGRAQPLSRSWNRIVANFGFEKDDFSLLLKTWYRIPESSSNDENPDINKYMGYGEIWGTYYWKKNTFSVMFRNNLRSNKNRNAVQFDWTFPFPYVKNDRVSGYFQYFKGYGENLIDYNTNTNRISIGVMLMDWN